MWHLKFFAIVLLLCSANILAERTYTITAPKNVRPDTSYQVVVSVHNTPEPVTVKVNVTCGSEPQQSSVGSVTVSDRETKKLDLPIGHWKSSQCEINVDGEGGIEFSRVSSLGFNDKQFSVFVQTDKAIYQPGQLVQFRVIVVDSVLKPYNSSSLNIHINDAQGNRIKQWNNVSVENGLYSNSLQLSSQPVLGDWSINVNLDSQKVSKDFTVAEYVLPKFEVNVRPPPYATFNDTDIVVSVDAKYTYGKPVKGTVLMNATERYCRGAYSYCASKPVVVTTEIDGTAHIKLPISQFDFPSYYRHSQASLDFLATVTETLTGKQMNGSAGTNIYQYKETIDISLPTPTFKPGLRYTFTIKLKYQDGTPVHDAKEKLKVRHGARYGQEDTESLYDIPADGTVLVDLYPTEDSHYVSITASYGDVSSSASVRRAQSISTKYLLLTLNDENPKVGDEVKVNVTGTFYFNLLGYEVVSRGKIVDSGSIDFGNDTKQQIVPLKITQEMAPRTRIVVYYVSTCGEVVADGLDFVVEGVFQTPVELSTSINHTKPGAPLDVIVETNPDALVALLAIDQSVLLLKSGNDITKNEIVSDLDGYESGWRPSRYDRKKRSFFWRPSADTVQELFNHAGLVFFSNGLFEKSGPSYGGYGGGYPGDSLFASAPRPAMAGPPERFAAEAAFDGGVRENAPKVRKSFPESWIWQTVAASKDGKAILNTTVPDTITSWVISAFALDNVHGLGLADGPTKVEVFRPFFVTLNLPYSVVRGETVSVQALVFNYMKNDVEAEVTLENPDDQFEFISSKNSVDGNKDAKAEIKTVKVKAGDGVSVPFLIEPKTVGHIDLKVSAIASNAGDALIRKLLVKAEGIPQYFNKALLADLRNTSEKQTEAIIDVPSYAVKDSEHVEVSAIGDILGPTINNLDHLLRMPYGCGEQNMLTLVPNIVVADYLTKAGRLTEELKEKAVKNMEAGYQRQLTYKRSDGSFSAFGENDKAGSTWLTAFVARSFHQAKPHISIDDRVIDNALSFLANQHQDNLTFTEPGEVHHKGLQGHSGSGIGFTAYTLLAFLENNNTEYKNLTDVTVKFLEDEVDDLDDTYELAIVTYTLHVANSNVKDKAFEKLLKKAEKQGELVYWRKIEKEPENKTDEDRYWYRPPKSLTIEATSYALLTHLLRGQVVEAIPIMRYLITQRNEFGGYASTQDTVIGIQALANMASHISFPSNSKVDISLKYDGREKSLTVDQGNAMVLQRIELPKETKEIVIDAKGNGVAIVQVTWSYNLNNKTSTPSFEVVPKVKVIDKGIFELTVCAAYTAAEDDDDRSNMAVIEINLPSGYNVDPEVQNANAILSTLKRVDITEGATKAELYFDHLDATPICPHITAYRTFDIANVRPAAIVVYDYYENHKRAEILYAPPETSLCEICTGDQCGSECKKN